MTRSFLVIAVAIAAIGATPSLARAPGLASSNTGRFAILSTPDGLVRLDTQSGAVSLCSRDGGEIRCRMSSDERSALEDKIEQLSRENSELKAKLAEASGRGGPKAQPVPSDPEIDRALGLMERFLRSFMQILREEPSADRT